MKGKRVAAALVAAFSAAALAQGHPHSHGVGRMDVAVDGKGFSVQLEMPLDSLVGFERAPRNAREQQALKDALASLRSDALFAIDPAAQCKPSKIEVAEPALNGGDAHADVDATHAFSCAKADALRAIDVAGLFKAFPRLRNVEVQFAGPRGQAKRTLTRSRAVLSW